MAVALRTQHIVTLEYMGMETIRALPPSLNDLHSVAIDWIQLPEHAHVQFRCPVQFISPYAARAIQGDYVYLQSEETYRLVTEGLRHGLKVEILTDMPSPAGFHNGALVPYAPPEPTVTEMEAMFKLEMYPHHWVEADFMLVSERSTNAMIMEDGTPVEGEFFGTLRFIHAPGLHRVDFEGSRVHDKYALANPSGLPVHPRSLRAIDTITRPIRSRSRYTFSVPAPTSADLIVRFSPLWTPAFSWPVPDRSDTEMQPTSYEFRFRAIPGGLLEHHSTKDTVTCIYVETTPDSVLMQTRRPYVDIRTSFALPFADFVDHMKTVLENLVSNVPTRTAFITDILNATANHPFVAYRFMESRRVRAAMDISLSADTEMFVWTRLFFLFRPVLEEEFYAFERADHGIKAARRHDWRPSVAWDAESRNHNAFRGYDMSILEFV